MNSQAAWSLVRTLITVFGASLAAHGLTTDKDVATAATDIMTIGPALASLVSILWGIYSHWNMKKVPVDSIAISADHKVSETPPVIGAMGVIQATSTQANGKAMVKVVGCLLALLIVGAVSDARAATTDPLGTFRNFAVSDIQNALDDAKANNDTDAANCWSAMLPIVKNAQSPLPTKPGVFLAFQKARDLVNTTNQVQAGVGPLADLKRACATVIIDTNTFLLRLGVLGAGAVFKPF